MVGVMKFYIKAEDILNKLSKEDREKYDQCFIIDVIRDSWGQGIEISCIAVSDKDEIKDLGKKDYYIYKFFDDGEISLDVKEE